MGTRADFYVGRGRDAEWLGSIAWDGYPDAMTGNLLQATTPGMFRTEVAAFLAERDDATTPEMGWPWPWEDSNLTDYAYAFDDGKVWATGGPGWFDPLDMEPENEGRTVEFPDMSARKAVTMGKRSGLLVFRR
jgi:hypothetical protein